MAAYSAFAEALLSLPAGATTGEAACVFAASGVPVFPVADGGKQPLTRHWFHDATTDLDRVRAWWSAAPAANIGMPTGAVSGMVVVDVDVHGPANGYVSLDRADRAGLLDGWELLIHTPSDGLHAYYPASPGVVQRSWQAARAGIDFRGDGGYIIVPPPFVLLDPAEQERRVASWGRVLATVCRSGRISMLQVLERTLPDSGTGLAQWWATHGTHDSSWASTTYSELIDRAGPAGERHATTLSLSLDMKAAARQIRTAGGGIRRGAAVLRQEMNTLTAALRSADLAPSAWLTCGQVAVILRSAYDPAIAATLERHGELGQNLATAGPVAVNESWNRLRTDSAHHAVLWISEWPRSMVYPGFLAPILLSTGIQRSFSLLCTPMRSDQAARDIRKKKTEYISDAAQRQKIGQIEDASQTAEYHDVLQQEADLTAGHGILRYTGLISVSAATTDDLDTAIAAIEQAAIQASCETRLLVGQQAQAFTAAALPLCRVV